jgi:hypothetical protein
VGLPLKTATVLACILALSLALLTLSACGGETSAAPVPWPGHEDDTQIDYATAQAAASRLNYYRSLAGSGPVALSYELSCGCRQHAAYMRANNIKLRDVGLMAHKEDPAAIGFTSAGALAGVNSVIYQGVAPTEAIDNWMNTLYHRLGLLDPNLYEIGFGTAGDIQVMDVKQGKTVGPQAQKAVVMFPAAGMELPGAFVNEIPSPVPGDDNLGTPITVEFFGDIGNSIGLPGVRLTYLTTYDNVPCYIQFPGQPILDGWDHDQLIVVLPKDRLTGGRSYRVSIAAAVDGKMMPLVWSFTAK